MRQEKVNKEEKDLSNLYAYTNLTRGQYMQAVIKKSNSFHLQYLRRIMNYIHDILLPAAR